MHCARGTMLSSGEQTWDFHMPSMSSSPLSSSLLRAHKQRLFLFLFQRSFREGENSVQTSQVICPGSHSSEERPRPANSKVTPASIFEGVSIEILQFPIPSSVAQVLSTHERFQIQKSKKRVTKDLLGLHTALGTVFRNTALSYMLFCSSSCFLNSPPLSFVHVV